MRRVMWSFGMQSRPMFHVGDAPDIENAVRAAAKAGIREAIIFGKDHTGLCFHPTEFGVQHPNAKIDLTAEMTSALHRHHMKSIAYFNVGQDGEMGRRHPEWLQEPAPGEVLVTADHIAEICVFGDYLTDYMMPVTMEMFRKYGIDGVFFDTMAAFRYCCCARCRAAFERDRGRPLPLPQDPENPDWDLYGPWQFERSRRFIETVRHEIHQQYPDAEVIFNHVGGPMLPHAFPGVLDGVVSCDPQAFYPWVTMYASYLSSLPRTGDIFIERFARGWGDRCDLDDATMRYKSAAIFIHRQRFCVGDRMHPDGHLAAGSAHAMKTIGDVWKKFDRALPDKLQNAPDFLLLYPESFQSGNAHRRFARMTPPRDLFFHFTGATRFLLDCGRSFMVTPEMALERNLVPGRVLVLSAVESINPETDRLIRAFVRQGGTVLVCETPPVLADGELPDYLGFKVGKGPRQTVVYLPAAGPGEHILVRGGTLPLQLTTARPLRYGYPQQYAEELQNTPYPYYNAPDSRLSDVPLVTVNRFGKGKVYFLNCSLLTDYADSALPGHREWGARLLRYIHPNAAAELTGKSGNVELVAYRKGRHGAVYALLNHGGRQDSFKELFVTEHIDIPQPAYAVTLKLRSDVPLEVYADGKRCSCRRKGEFISVPLVMDRMWRIITVKPAKTAIELGAGRQ